MVDRGPGKVVSVRLVAEKAGWPYLRMLRHLKRQDEALNGMLLIKQGSGRSTRYSLTWDALEQLHPQWFLRVQGLNASVEENRSLLEELEVMVEQAHKDIGEMQGTYGKKIETLTARVARLERESAKPRIIRTGGDS